MGLFSTQYRTYVGTSVSRVFEDKIVSDISRIAPIKAILLGERIAERLLQEILGGYGTKINRTYIAAQGGSYTLGLPTHTFISDTVGYAETEAILATLTGGAVSIEYHHLSGLHAVHVGMEIAVNTHGYNNATNELETLSASVGFPCYLEGILGVINTEVTGDLVDAPGGSVYINPTEADMSIWSASTNNRYVPWINPQLDNPHWLFSDTLAHTSHMFYGYASDIPRAGTTSETNQNAYDAAVIVAQAAIDAAQAVYDSSLDLADLNVVTLLQLAFDLNQTVPLLVWGVDLDIEDYVYHVEIELGLGGYTLADDHYQTKYYYDLDNVAGPSMGYFTYNTNGSSHPTLDDLLDDAGNAAEFMPIIPFIENGVDVSSASLAATADHISKTTLMNSLGFDYTDIGVQIMEQNTAGQVNGVYWVYGIPADGKHLLEIRYLYEFFHWVAINDVNNPRTLTENDVADLQTGYTQQTIGNLYANKAFTIQDRDYKATLRYSTITSILLTGVTTVDVYTDDDYVTNPIPVSTRPALVGEGNSVLEIEQDTYTAYVNEIIDDQPTATPQTRTRDIDVWTYTIQVSANTYREVRVAALDQVFIVRDRESLVDTSQDNASILIPVNYNLVTQAFTAIEKDTFMGRATHFQATSWERHHIPWYATTLFQGIVLTFAVAVTISSLGTATTEVKAALAAYGSLAAIEMVAIWVFKAIIIDLAFQFIAEKVGGDVAVLLALAALATAAYTRNTNPDFAKDALWASMNLVHAGKTQLQVDLQDVMREAEAFELYMEEQDKKDQENMDLLFGLDDPMHVLETLILRPPFIVGQTPAQFFEKQRVGNPGIASLDQIENFVATKIKLPTLQDSIKQFTTKRL